MRHRQAVRQGTLTPPSQVRLLLAQLEKTPHGCWKIQCSCGVLLFLERRGRALRSGLLGPVFPAKRRKKFVEMPQQKSCAPARASGAKNRAFSPSHQRPGLPVQALKTQRSRAHTAPFGRGKPGFCRGRQKRQMPDLPSGFRQKRLRMSMRMYVSMRMSMRMRMGKTPVVVFQKIRQQQRQLPDPCA